MEVKCYVVTYSDFIEEYPARVFTDKTKAEKFAKEHTNDEYTYYVHNCFLEQD